MSNDTPDMFANVCGTLEVAARYPNVPGFKRAGTSELAAKEMRRDAGTLRAAVLSVLGRHDATSDEIAAELGESVLSIRPRVSEAIELGRVIMTGERRYNASGKRAAVWTLVV